MHIAVLNWFGWSLLWLLPLLARFVGGLLGHGSGIGGRGTIRLWLGSVLMLIASSAIESALRGVGANLFGSWIGAKLAGVLGSAGGGLFLAGAVALALYWMFKRAGDKDEEDVPAPARSSIADQATLPRRTLSAEPPPLRANPGSLRAATTPPPRKQASWSLPKPIPLQETVAGRRHPAPLHPAGKDEPRSAARAPSAWDAVESLRPTDAMLARAQAREEAARRERELRKQREQMENPKRYAGPAPSPSSPIPAPVANGLSANAEVIDSSEFLPPGFTIDPAPAAWHTPVPASEEFPVIDSSDIFFGLDAAPEPMPLPLPVQRVDVPPVPRSTPPAASLTVTHTAAPSRPASHWMPLPGLSLLDAGDGGSFDIPQQELDETGQLIEQRLKEFKVPVTVLGAGAGPVITRYEVEPAIGVRGAQIVGLMKDLARALGLTSIRVVETIPGKTCMGLELPNLRRQMIRLSEILESDAYRGSASNVTIALGKDITGKPVVTDLARAPHMLVAGTTGSGKSVAINAMILSLLYKSTPDDVRLIMIDPKMLELSVYDGIAHLLAPVVTDMKLAANALSWCVAEMDRRYRLMSALGVRNLAGYNQKIRDAAANGRKVSNPFSLTPDAPEPLDPLPMIVVIIDELADLMMVAGKKIEELIARLAQKARAAGIHLILATQRPSVDVITGLIKANIPTRVAFQVSSKIDSRTVLDQMGAEALLGHGDMLFLPPGSGYPQRVHGAFVSDQEVHRVVEYLKQFGEPDYEDAVLAGPASAEEAGETAPADADAEADPLYDEAVAFVIRTRKASISSVQRQLRVGYNRAARLVEQMETAGILSAMSSNGSRDVLAPPGSDA
ncbi:MAG: cell division protein [Burkholderia sp.]|nr:cell division protein [Burkholderia sp.]